MFDFAIDIGVLMIISDKVGQPLQKTVALLSSFRERLHAQRSNLATRHDRVTEYLRETRESFKARVQDKFIRTFIPTRPLSLSPFFFPP